MSKPGAPPQRRSTVFRPRFTLVVVYLALFTTLFAFAFALPDLIAGARELPGGPAELTPEEIERGSEIMREVLGGGGLLNRLMASFLCAACAVGAGAWFRALPGLR